MTDYGPYFSAFPAPIATISPYGLESYAFSALREASWAAPGSSVVVASQARYYPFVLNEPVTVYGLGWMNGSAVSGNADAGIYDQYGTRIVSTGLTAQAGVSARQTVTLGSPQALLPGNYYLASGLDNGTGRFFALSGFGDLSEASGLQSQASAIPLPSTATFTVSSLAAAFWVVAFVVPIF